MHERKRVLVAALVLGIGIILCCAMAWALNSFRFAISENEACSSEVLQGIEGLPAGVPLDSKPNKIADGYAIFDDRAVRLLEFDQETVDQCVSNQAVLLDSIPEGVARCFVVTPTRAMFEPSLEDVAGDQQAVIDYAYEQVPEGVTCVDASSVLKQHEDEYLFYRSDPHMTSLGSYWVSRAVVDACGVETIDISEYIGDDREMSFYGEDSSLLDEDVPADLNKVYIHPDLPNSMMMSRRTKEGDITDFLEAPAIAVSRGAVDASLGKRISCAVIDGAAGNGRTLLVVGRGDAKSVATWLIASFDRVIFVEEDWNKLTPGEFASLFDEYEVTDFLLDQSVDAMTSADGNGSIVDLVRG